MVAQAIRVVPIADDACGWIAYCGPQHVHRAEETDSECEKPDRVKAIAGFGGGWRGDQIKGFRVWLSKHSPVLQRTCESPLHKAGSGHESDSFSVGHVGGL